MQVLVPGHQFRLDNVVRPDQPGQILVFVNNEFADDDLSRTVNKADGTTLDEVISAAIERSRLLNKRTPCRENSIVLTKLEEAQLWLRKRAADCKAPSLEANPRS